MRCSGICMLVSMLLAPLTASAQDHPNAVSISGLLSTSSELFPHSDSPDETVRNQFLPLDNILGISADFRRQFDALGIELGLSVEYFSKTDVFFLPVTYTRSIPLTDGFTAIPIELSGYFRIPVGDETFQLYLGGGGGLYIGSRNYHIASATARTIGRTAQLGIHVLSGVQYAASPLISIRSEVKFRDVEFETVNKFDQGSVSYDGMTVALDQKPLVSRISINGMTISLGLAAHF